MLLSIDIELLENIQMCLYNQQKLLQNNYLVTHDEESHYSQLMEKIGEVFRKNAASKVESASCRNNAGGLVHVQEEISNNKLNGKMYKIYVKEENQNDGSFNKETKYNTNNNLKQVNCDRFSPEHLNICKKSSDLIRSEEELKHRIIHDRYHIKFKNSHTDTVKFKCTRCPKIFKRKHDCSRHQLLVHSLKVMSDSVKNGKTPPSFICLICSKITTSRKDLKQHLGKEHQLFYS